MKHFLLVAGLVGIAVFAYSVGQRIDPQVISMLLGAVVFGGLLIPFAFLFLSYKNEDRERERRHQETLAQIAAQRQPTTSFNLLYFADEQSRTLETYSVGQQKTIDGQVTVKQLPANHRPQAYR